MPEKIKKYLLNIRLVIGNFIHCFCKYKYLKSKRIPWTTGYSQYKYDVIGELINSSRLSCFKDGKLLSGYGYRLDERAVEYPWFFARLKETELVILDAGSVLNHRQILTAKSLSWRQLYISTLHFEGFPDVVPPPSYVFEDIRHTCFKDDFFDAICSLSTLEHVGMDNTRLYTSDPAKKENEKYAYLEAVYELKRVLRAGGTLYLSVPFGVYKNHGWFQVFDSDMVSRLIEAFAPAEMEKTFFRYENDQWNYSDEAHCIDGICFDMHSGDFHQKDYLAFSRCVVCLELKK